MPTTRLTMAQALIRYLKSQYVERDGTEQRFFGGCFGIFGHGNLAGVGQALQEHPEFPFIPFRNEQAMVHAAVGYARMKNRLGAYACTSSIGPGATNMVTGAALATINRVPVLLLPGDIFSRRNVAPVLQQLESEGGQDLSVNDCFKPVSRYWDRLNRPEQLIYALPEAMRVLTSPAQTGAVTLALPQDVQAEAFDYPSGLFQKRVWAIPRARPDRAALERAVALIRASRRPMVIAGGGVLYSDACEVLSRFASTTGIPIGETQAGKSSVPFGNPQGLGGVGATGTRAANLIAREADLVIGVGTRYADFTTASKTAFQNPAVRFININVAELDAYKHSGLCLVGDARAALGELLDALAGFRVDEAYGARIATLRSEWDAEVGRLYSPAEARLPSQAEVIGALNERVGPTDVVINAAGSAPGDLHKLWRSKNPGTYHLEYGYSCMGYEIPAGLGVKLAAPEREVYVLVGDGTYLMAPQEIATAIQEGLKLTVLLIDSHGFASIGALSSSLGSNRFGTEWRKRGADGKLSGEHLPIDFVANAMSLGARGVRARDLGQLEKALAEARRQDQTTVIVIETDPERRVGGYDSWWDVPVAEVSTMPGVQKARVEYQVQREKERCFHAEEEGK
ncbi:MAG: 3D-(3,5/4)-trihydroxycyclohexane-1,2-dione acylhydrolase (decyclizing) [Myxococcaceae bacterium]